MKRRPKIIVHNHYGARDVAARDGRMAKTASGKEVELDKKQPDGGYYVLNGQGVAVKVFIPQRHDSRSRDTWYHDSQVNGYYILKGAVGDEGRWLVRNGKYDIVKTTSSKPEAVSFAKQSKNGGASQQQIAADHRSR